MIYIVDEGEFDNYEITNKIEKRRLWHMMKGEAEAKENFKYLSKHGVRS
mgnify:CR=1 FL=1